MVQRAALAYDCLARGLLHTHRLQQVHWHVELQQRCPLHRNRGVALRQASQGVVYSATNTQPLLCAVGRGKRPALCALPWRSAPPPPAAACVCPTARSPQPNAWSSLYRRPKPAPAPRRVTRPFLPPSCITRHRHAVIRYTLHVTRYTLHTIVTPSSASSSSRRSRCRLSAICALPEHTQSSH